MFAFHLRPHVWRSGDAHPVNLLPDIRRVWQRQPGKLREAGQMSIM
jgi:hypothetical protein